VICAVSTSLFADLSMATDKRPPHNLTYWVQRPLS